MWREQAEHRVIQSALKLTADRAEALHHAFVTVLDRYGIDQVAEAIERAEDAAPAWADRQQQLQRRLPEIATTPVYVTLLALAIRDKEGSFDDYLMLTEAWVATVDDLHKDDPSVIDSELQLLNEALTNTNRGRLIVTTAVLLSDAYRQLSETRRHTPLVSRAISIARTHLGIGAIA